MWKPLIKLGCVAASSAISNYARSGGQEQRAENGKVRAEEARVMTRAVISTAGEVLCKGPVRDAVVDELKKAAFSAATDIVARKKLTPKS